MQKHVSSFMVIHCAIEVDRHIVIRRNAVGDVPNVQHISTDRNWLFSVCYKSPVCI